MRALLAVLAIGLLAGSGAATTITVGPPNPQSPPDALEIQDGITLADPGDTVLVRGARYDDVRTFTTSNGRRTAVCRVPDGVILRGQDRADVIIDHTFAEYGILCTQAGSGARIENLTITGGAGRDRGRTDDGDGRNLVAGIACMDGGNPTIVDVTIEDAATGIVVRSDGLPSAPTIEGVLIARGSHHGIYIFDNGVAPVVLDGVTVVANFAYGVYVSNGSATIKSSCLTHNGKSGVWAHLSSPTIRYSNLYWNDRASSDPRNYGGSLADLTGIDGNITEEPYYCGYTGMSGYDYHVCNASPNIGTGEGGRDIGCFGQGCLDCESPVEGRTWGALKWLWK